MPEQEDEFLLGLSEVRTCASIIGLACSRLVKKYMTNIKSDEHAYNLLKMLDETLTRLNEQICQLEDSVAEENANGPTGTKKPTRDRK